jgi:hypothetical protein
LGVAGHMGLAVAVPILAGVVFFTPRLLTSSHPGGPEGTPPPSEAAIDRVASTTEVGHAADRDDQDDANGFVDLYGNEVTDAVATYTFDRTGSLYELHSPQTELPRLGMPKS